MTETVPEPLVGDPPPPDNRHKYKWNRYADLARDNPGEWVRIFERDRYSTAVSAKRNHWFRKKAGEEFSPFGFRLRTTNNGSERDAHGLVRQMVTLRVLYDPAHDTTLKTRRKKPAKKQGEQ